MPIRPGIDPPACLRHFGTTWMLVSDSGGALVMDAGSADVAQRVQDMLDRGELKSVEGLWVTHYHDDHTAGIPQFQQRFPCPCLTDRRLADVLTQPTAWRLPCVFPEPIRVDQSLQDGHSWQWHEFQLTSFYYPGQTLYHAALLVQHQALRMLFVGDSHTAAGIDDYCAYNRNWLGEGVGFRYCLDLIEKLQPTHIFNCHVDDAFTFTPDEIEQMRANLQRRESLFGQLVPWPHANVGLDPSWARCHPYTQHARPGETVRLEVVITNHSSQPMDAACRRRRPVPGTHPPPSGCAAKWPPKRKCVWGSRCPSPCRLPRADTSCRWTSSTAPGIYPSSQRRSSRLRRPTRDLARWGPSDQSFHQPDLLDQLQPVGLALLLVLQGRMSQALHGLPELVTGRVPL